MNIKYISIILSSYISLINCTVHFAKVYGVSDEDLGKYQETPDGLFHCLDGNGVIPYSALNDDYCDCADGSDEPGTSACPNSRFYCRNHGKNGNFIPSSRVNDGICDYELCCDGSDEYNGYVRCPDKCNEIEKKKLLEKTKRFERVLLSFQNRSVMTMESLNSTTYDKLQLKIKMKEHENIESKLNSTKLEIKKLEKTEKETKDYYKILYKDLKVNFKKSQERLKKAIEDILTIKNNKKDINKKEINTIFNEYSETLLNEFIKPNIQENNEKNETQSEKPTESSTETPTETPTENSNENSNENSKSEEDKEEERLLAQIEESHKKIKAQLSSYRSEKYNLERDASSLKREIEALEKKLLVLSGKYTVYYSLIDKVFTLNTTDYTYSLKWGREINQKQNKGSTTLLGKFKKFIDNKTILYDEGTQCWKGPKRSVKINLLCGPVNEIIKVDEPSKCQYVMDFETPGVCSEKDIKDIRDSDKKIKKENSEFSEEVIDEIKKMLDENPTQQILDEDEVLGSKNDENEAEEINETNDKNENEQKHDEL